MIITSLIENTSIRKDLTSEHGLSIHIRHQDSELLFDTGMTGKYAENAIKMGINLEKISCGVISHHHYDHGGGLRTLFKTSPDAKVHLMKPSSKSLKFKALGFVNKEIGLPWGKYGKHRERMIYMEKEILEIQKDIFLSRVTEHSHPKPRGNRHLLMFENGRPLPDDFKHELIMTIKSEEGLVIFTGCSHNGILNMIETVRKQFPGEPVKAIIGGFHMIDSPILGNMSGTPEDVKKLGKEILAHRPERVFTGHCTGDKAFNILKEVMGERLEMLATGTVVKL